MMSFVRLMVIHIIISRDDVGGEDPTLEIYKGFGSLHLVLSRKSNKLVNL